MKFRTKIHQELAGHYRAAVVDETGKKVSACMHAHKGERQAQECAEKMKRIALSAR